MKRQRVDEAARQARALLARDVGGKKDKKHKTWNAKEKRKRDMGQSSRGKSFVEEEKRILRQYSHG